MGIIGRGQGFRDVKRWYTRIAALERCTCLLQGASGQPHGTGFLVAPDIVLTAAHVSRQGLSRPDDPFGVRFDYAVSEKTGQVLEGTRCPLVPDPIIVSSQLEQLDVCLLRVALPVGEQIMADTKRPRGWVELAAAKLDPEEGSFLAIFQHADGGPLRVAMNSESVVGFIKDGQRLLHRTDTSPGSSGAPCFDIDWRPLAMHQAFTIDHGHQNIAVPFSAIIPWLQAEGVWPLMTKPAPDVDEMLPEGAGLPAITTFGMGRELRHALMTEGESQRLELKERAVALVDGKPRLSRKIVQTVAAFMNSKGGGSVLIGVTDDKKFVGITDEFALVNPQRASWDGFDLWLRNTLAAQLDGPMAKHSFSTRRYHEQDQEICAIHVESARSPVFVGHEFYLRVGPMTQPVRGHEMLAYISDRWSIFGASSLPREHRPDDAGPALESTVRRSGEGD